MMVNRPAACPVCEARRFDKAAAQRRWRPSGVTAQPRNGSVDQQERNPGRDCADHQHSQQGEKGVGILALKGLANARLVMGPNRRALEHEQSAAA